MTTSGDERLEALVAWIQERDRHRGETLTEDTPLFLERRLTSLDLPELLLLLEELTESTMSIHDITPERFSTIRAMQRAFLR